MFITLSVPDSVHYIVSCLLCSSHCELSILFITLAVSYCIHHIVSCLHCLLHCQYPMVLITFSEADIVTYVIHRSLVSITLFFGWYCSLYYQYLNIYQWSEVSSIDQNLQPLTGNGDVSVRVKYSRVAWKIHTNKQNIGTTPRSMIAFVTVSASCPVYYTYSRCLCSLALEWWCLIMFITLSTLVRSWVLHWK